VSFAVEVNESVTRPIANSLTSFRGIPKADSTIVLLRRHLNTHDLPTASESVQRADKTALIV
jgi:hypothetical protein